MNHRLASLAFAAAFVLASTPIGAEEPGAPALFRQISVSTGVVIALDEPFSPAGLAVSAGDGVYALRPGKFSGAEKLFVMVSAEGRVSGMQFIYSKDVSFDEVVARYRTRFGEPRPLDAPDQDSGVYWQDGRTRFEILRQTATVAVSSRLLPAVANDAKRTPISAIRAASAS